MIFVHPVGVTTGHSLPTQGLTYFDEGGSECSP
jgi:hypothetical protein